MILNTNRDVIEKRDVTVRLLKLYRRVSSNSDGFIQVNVEKIDEKNQGSVL